MANIFAWVLARMVEPTTWGGLATLLTGVGVVLKPDQAAAITSLGVAIGGALMVFLPEGTKK